jgi:hypothetical protein
MFPYNLASLNSEHRLIFKKALDKTQRTLLDSAIPGHDGIIDNAKVQFFFTASANSVCELRSTRVPLGVGEVIVLRLEW